MSRHELYPGQRLEQMMKESEKSEDNKKLPIGFSKFNVKDAKHVHIPVFKPKSKNREP